MDKCKDCENYMCKEAGSYFLRDMYIEKCKQSCCRLFLPPKEDRSEDKI